MTPRTYDLQQRIYLEMITHIRQLGRCTNTTRAQLAATTQPYTHYSKPNEIQLEHFNNEYSRIFNLVPDDIRAITSTKEFKIALAKYLANNDDFNHY